VNCKRGFSTTVLLALGMSAVVSNNAFGDAFHYNNVIIGERAQGLGGAYAGISDDASGVYYNPAGLAFAQSNDISGSANAFFDRKITYKNVFEGQNFTEKSGGTFSPFFGAMQKLDSWVTGLVGGFAYYTLDNELTDQSDFIQNGRVSADIQYHELRRTMNRRGSTIGASLGFGYRLSPSLSLGFSLTYANTDDLTQFYLVIDQTSPVRGADGQVVSTRETVAQNTRERLTLYGLEPQVGVQWAITPSLVWGTTLRKGQYASQKFQQDNYYTIISPVQGNGTQPETRKSVNPMGSPPLQLRTGVAYFASPEVLFAFDAIHTGAVTDMEATYKRRFKRAAVTNLAFGSEYYVSPSFPLRLGLFTNNDARESYVDQGEKIDYKGLSLFFAWAQPNSQISIGTVVQKGEGNAQKVVAGITQKVEATAYMVGFSATHSF
jgi:hypothetical protein